MDLIAACLLSIIAIEVLFRLPILAHAKMVVSIFRKSVSVISSKTMSDHRKEALLLSYARNTIRQTFVLLLLLLCLILVILLPALLIDALLGFNPSVIDTFTSSIRLTITITVALFYAILRKQQF